MEHSEAASTESSNVFVGVGAGVVGAVAAAALFASCNNKKQIAANEEAFIRAWVRVFLKVKGHRRTKVYTVEKQEFIQSYLNATNFIYSV